MTTDIGSDAAAIAALARSHASKFTIYDAGTVTDPFPQLRAVRSGCPVAHSDQFGGFWLVTKYEDIRFVLQNPDIFSSTVNTVPPRKDTSVGSPIPLNLDPPEHDWYRTLLEPLVSPRVARSIEPEIREKVRGLITAAKAKGTFDFVGDFAAKLPGMVFLPLLGLDIDDLDELLNLHQELVATTRYKPEDRELATKVRERAEKQLHLKTNALLDARQAAENPPKDILTALALGEVDGRPVGRPEALRTVKLLFAAALDTVRNSLSMAVYVLAARPDLKAKIMDNPRAIPTAIEEFLRFFSPAPTGRLIMRDVTVGGVDFKAGDMVIVPLVSANHDPDVFDEPDDFILDRRKNAHIAFGAGPHRCLGSHLARMELRVALEEIHTLMPDYQLADDREPVMHGGAIVGIDQLNLIVGE
jgi:cytochrome P450